MQKEDEETIRREPSDASLATRAGCVLKMGFSMFPRLRADSTFHQPMSHDTGHQGFQAADQNKEAELLVRILIID